MEKGIRSESKTKREMIEKVGWVRRRMGDWKEKDELSLDLIITFNLNFFFSSAFACIVNTKQFVSISRYR